MEDISLERKTLYDKAVSKWGVGLQLDMLTEECAELIQAVNKVKRSNFDPKYEEKLAEEIADVQIMIEQIICSVFNYNFLEEIKYYKKKKLERLAEMLKDTEGEKE